ncbi:PepSY domain-containing protein [Nocardia crassostreae]|uniref:PepSY domain-containing protein n=1 Tax=Nocardia crassostreae TaxID=53428 RepID=UPI000B20C2E7|nr:PepSY domain-containing protein [Nocardia crassostreae]
MTVSNHRGTDGLRRLACGAILDGSPAWEIDVRTRTGTEYEVEVDAMTGMVISIEESAA